MKLYSETEINVSKHLYNRIRDPFQKGFVTLQEVTYMITKTVGITTLHVVTRK